MNMRGEVAIAEIEPSFAAVYGEALEEMKSFAAHAPAFRGIDDSGERVGDDVQIGGNFQTVHNDVVAGVNDDGEVARIHRMGEAEEKLRCSDTAGKSRDREFFCERHGGDKDAGERRWSQVEKAGVRSGRLNGDHARSVGEHLGTVSYGSRS